jgi:heavy metal sensor kinase
MRFGILREFFGRLHFRLTLWYTAILLLMVIVTMVGVREGLRLTLLAETDQLLTDDALEFGLTFEEFYPNVAQIRHELERTSSTHAHRGLFVQVLGPDGKVRWQTTGAPTLALGPTRATARVKPFTSGGFRLVERKIDRGDSEPGLLRVGSSLQPLQDDVSKLTNMMLLVGAAILFVSPLGGYWLAGRSTQPLTWIMDTTARLHPANLEERLQLRGTRDELDRLSATINGFLDRIAAYLRQNREFTANAAHELRSPLAAVQNSLEVALNAERSTEEYKELIGETLEECGILRDLVNQLLLLAESDAGRFEIGAEAIRLDHVVAKSCEMFAGVAEAAELTLNIRLEPVQVYGEAGRLRQVINNLVDNAIKFSARGGLINVELAIDSATRQAVLRVSDTGQGIAVEDVPHVFERFYRGDKSRQRKSKTGGTGLGLSICESIVEAHGGQIQVESVQGQGTSVTVYLTAAPTSTEMRAAAIANTEPVPALGLSEPRGTLIGNQSVPGT